MNFSALACHLLAVTAFCADFSGVNAAAGLPNILIVYADDLGYGDLSSYNSRCAYRTPRLDQLADEGIRFIDAHSPCTICSPSRYGLLSGNLVCRTGRRPTAFEGPGGPSYLAADSYSLGQMLQQHGYRTGVFGKWHLGLTWLNDQGEVLNGGFENSLLIDYERSCPLIDGPQMRGFDRSFVTPNCPTTDPLYVYIEDGTVVTPASQRHRSDSLPNPAGKWRWDNDEGWTAADYHFTDADLLFAARTEQFIRTHRREHPDRPFFALLSTQIAHAPVLPAEEFNGVTDAGPRGDFVRELDILTGRILDLLDELQISDDTLVIFNSDNGPETLHTHWMRTDHNHDAAGGFRGMKRDGWEGGHRVPLIVRWSGTIPAGQVTSQLANTTDLFATIASIIGCELPKDSAVDSFDLLPALLGVQSDRDPIRPLMLTQSFRGEFQLRLGHWKYLAHTGSGGNRYDSGMLLQYHQEDTAPDAPAQLYNLHEDPQETTNLYFMEQRLIQECVQILQEVSPATGRTALRVRTPIGPAGIQRLRQKQR